VGFFILEVGLERGLLDNIRNNTLKTAAATAAVVGGLVVPAVEAQQEPGEPLAHASMEKAASTNHHKRHHKVPEHHGLVVKGATSTFGWPAESDGRTADGGSTRRACIALRSHSTLGRLFRLTVGHHHTVVKQCDWGPAQWTGRDIDLTGKAAHKLHLNPYHYPTDKHGVAREIRR
jgi:hypothetical protein